MQVILEDDVDGSEGAETLQFAVDGVSLRDRPVGGERQAAARRVRRVGGPCPSGHSRGGSGQRGRRTNNSSGSSRLGQRGGGYRHRGDPAVGQGERARGQ
nr:hypothetical protein [Angustibacter aerolatus]